MCKEAVDFTRGRLREAGAVEVGAVSEVARSAQAAPGGELGLAGLAHGSGAGGAARW